jgi:hypothetical protein
MKKCNIQQWSKRSVKQKKHHNKKAWCSLQNYENKLKNGVIQQLSLCSTN